MLAASFSLPSDDAHVAEVEIRRHRPGVEIDGALEAPGRFGQVLAAHRLEPDLVLEERQNGLALRLRFGRGELGQPLTRVVRVGPLVLFLLQLLQVDAGRTRSSDRGAALR